MVSLWNVVLLAVCMAVLYPIKNKCFNWKKHCWRICCSVYVYFSIFTAFMTCKNKIFQWYLLLTLCPSWFYYWYGTNKFVFCLITMLCYGRIVFALRSWNNRGSVIDIINAVSATLLRMAITVKSVFAGVVGYAQCYFIVANSS